MNWIPFFVVNVVGNLVTALVFLAVMKNATTKTEWTRDKKARVLITTSVVGSVVLALANLVFALQLASTGENLWGLILWGGAMGFHISSAFTNRRSIARKAGLKPHKESE